MQKECPTRTIQSIDHGTASLSIDFNPPKIFPVIKHTEFCKASFDSFFSSYFYVGFCVLSHSIQQIHCGRLNVSRHLLIPSCILYFVQSVLCILYKEYFVIFTKRILYFTLHHSHSWLSQLPPRNSVTDPQRYIVSRQIRCW